LRVEHAQISLLGARETTRIASSRSSVSDQAALANSLRMAWAAMPKASALRVLAQALLYRALQPDPAPAVRSAGVSCIWSIGAAHQKVVMTGAGMPLETRPRATCAVMSGSAALVAAYWAHVGDSRIYHLRGGRMVTRTRSDHSHVEVLVRRRGDSRPISYRPIRCATSSNRA